MISTKMYLDSLLNDQKNFKDKLHNLGVSVTDTTFTGMISTLENVKPVPFIEHARFTSYPGGNEIQDMLDYIDSSKFTDETMVSMFQSAKNVTELNLYNWYSPNITNLYYTFQNCYNLTTVNMYSLKTNNVTNLYGTFEDCYNLRNLYTAHWNLINATDMCETFHYCSNLTSLYTTGWNMSNVERATNLFRDCRKLSTLNLNQWNTGKMITAFAMFANCYSLTELNISGWNVENLRNMSMMFYSVCNINELNLSGWNTTKLRTMRSSFEKIENIDTVNLSGWRIYNYCMNSYYSEINTNGFNLEFAFSSAKINVLNLSNIVLGSDGSTVRGGYTGMFTSARINKVIEVDTPRSNSSITYWDAGSFHPLNNAVFNDFECSNCVYPGFFIGVLVAGSVNVNITNLDAGMGPNFSIAYNSPNLRVFNTTNISLTNIRSLYYTFAYCRNLPSLDLSNWDVSNITSFSSMCTGCYNLTDVNITGWNISNANYVGSMFAYCNNLSNSSINNIINMCLTGINITTKNLSNTNSSSPFYNTKFDNSYYTSYHTALTQAGWTF